MKITKGEIPVRSESSQDHPVPKMTGVFHRRLS